ncbi:MAG TPA: hypothetical protein VE981_00450 [Planctomycetota bacterium]|nr:hypothetical protein [Planctomycetota bacterium]
MKTMLAGLAALVAVGCQGGFDRAAMESELQANCRIFVDDPDVFRVEQVRPQLQMPFRLAVVPPSMINQRDGRQPGETEGERAEIQAWGERLRREGIISDLILIPDMMVGGMGSSGSPGSFKAIRVAAARLGADAILVLHSVTEIDSYINPLGVLDLTLVGMFLIPGHHKDTMTIVEGLLIDNRNQYVYFAGSAEGKGSSVAPLAMLDEKGAVRESRCAALKSFGDLLVQQSHRVPGLPSSRYETPGR